MKPQEYAPDRCKEFVAYLHKIRADRGAAPLTDEEAAEVFNALDAFADARSESEIARLQRAETMRKRLRLDGFSWRSLWRRSE